MNKRKLIAGIFSIPKSLIYDIYIFGLREGIKLPIIFHYKTRIKVRRGTISTSNQRVFFGFGGPEGVSSNNENWFISSKGTIFFEGKANFGKGSTIRCDSGEIHIGSNFSANKNFWLAINDSFKTGENVVIGSNVRVRDNDGHQVNSQNDLSRITIGNHVWINDNTTILKGVALGDNTIVGTSSVVTRSICKNDIPKNSILAGNPSIVVKKIQSWEL